MKWVKRWWLPSLAFYNAIMAAALIGHALWSDFERMSVGEVAFVALLALVSAAIGGYSTGQKVSEGRMELLLSCCVTES